MTDEEIQTTISRLSAQIDQIQVKIDQINNLTDEAIAKLEAQKRDLRIVHPNYSTIQKNIHDINVDHDQVVNKLLQKQTHVKARKASLDQLDFTVAQLDREISRIQADRDRTIFELNKKREDIMNALKSTESLTIQITRLTQQLELLSSMHSNEMAALQKELADLQARTDLTDSQKQLALAELTRKIREKEEVYQQHVKSLEKQREESMLLLKDYTDEETSEMKQNLLSEIDDLEAMKVGASPSEVEAINRKIAALKEQLEELDMLAELRSRGLRLTPSGRIQSKSGTIYTIEEARQKGLLDGLNLKLFLDDKLKETGLSITKSGNIRTKSGRHLSLSEAKEQGLLKDDIFDLIQGTSKKSSLSGSSTSLERLSDQDVNYLKITVGKPLTLALAEICVKQPRDPIHYLGHWLFKYRYNQEIDDIKKKEVEELIAERERIRLETWHTEIEEAARATVMEMIFKAHEESVKNQLQAAEAAQILAEATGEGEEENDELAEEAKDVLGEYNGPPVGQRRI